MIPVITIREYDSLTGEYVRSYSSLEFGNILAGGESKIGVFDFVITGVSNISDFKIMVHSSGGLEVSPPDATVTDNVADNGNFGVEFSSTFEVKTSLANFFTDIDLSVSVDMRTENITNYVYMNLSPGTFEKTDGSIAYRISFNYLPIVSSSSSSSLSSSSYSSSCSSFSCSSSSSLQALLYYTFFDYVPITEPLYFKRIAEECEDKSLIYENVDNDIIVAEYPCDTGTWVIVQNSSVIGINYDGVLGTYSNGWIITEA